MPLIHERRGLVVTGAPGTGSTSLLAAFAALPGVRAVPASDILDPDGRQVLDAKHATVADLIAADLLPNDHHLRILTTTRNPFTYWPAEWNRSRTRWAAELNDPDSWVRRQPGALERIVNTVEQDFGPWLRSALEPELTTGGARRVNPGHVDEADLILRIEHIDDDLAAVGMECLVEVPHLNRSAPRQRARDYYDDELRSAIETLYQADLERFHYSF